ncbi:MAG: transporter substrate-binding domain-containing protein [Geminicoccaceae bacterium]
MGAQLSRRVALATGLALPLAARGARAGLQLRLVTGELPPYCFHVPPPTVAEGGRPMGLVYDVVREVAGRVGNPQTVEFLPWPRAQELALAGPDVGILALTRSPEREDRYRWIFNVVTDELVLAGLPGVELADLAALKDRPVGVLRMSGAETLLRELGFTSVEPAAEERNNAMRLRERRIEAWLAPRLMVRWAWQETGGEPDQLAFGEVVRPSEIWFAGSPGVEPEIAALWARRFEELKADGGYERIVARYLRPRSEPLPQRELEIPWGTRG